MYNADENFLTGKCLAAAPNLNNSPFANAVVYICSHTKSGAIGFMFNKKIKEFSFSDLAAPLPIDSQRITDNIDLYQGGPVEQIRGFVLHSPEYVRDDTILIKNCLAISSSVDILSDIAYGIGPKENLIALGYMSWGPNQLEKEIINNCWIVSEPSSSLIFHTKDEDKWQRAIDESGIDFSRTIMVTGNA